MAENLEPNALEPLPESTLQFDDSRVQLTHHMDKRDGVAEKQSIRKRLRSGKSEHPKMQNEKENHREVEIT